MKQRSFDPSFVSYLPAQLDEGVLYVSLEHATSSHLCACGCGERVVTPLGRSGWQLYFDGTVTLQPSIGNGQFKCRSHYFIRQNRVIWSYPMTDPQTTRARQADGLAVAQEFARHQRSGFRELVSKLFGGERKHR